MTKKILAAALAVILLVQIMPLAFAKTAKTKSEPKYYISLEGLTLGQGMYIEPTYYTLSEVQETMSEKYSIDVTADNITAAMLTATMFFRNGIEFDAGSDLSSFYLQNVKGIDKGYLDIPSFITDVTSDYGYDNDENDGNDDDWLGAGDYTMFTGWMYTSDEQMADKGAGEFTISDGDYMRWQFTFYGYGTDLGYSSEWSGPAMFEGLAHRNTFNKYYADINHDHPDFFTAHPDVKAAALSVMEKLDAQQSEVDSAYDALRSAFENQEDARQQRDFSELTDAVMEYLSSTLTQPKFGSEWVIMALARSGKLDISDKAFADYYNNVVEYVNEKAEAVGMNGAIDKNKSTENSRLIIALSAIGKDARKVGNWDLVKAYEENGISWITKQGINGAVYALLALDTVDYKLADENRAGGTLRDELVDFILGKEISGGGFALSGSNPDPDITGMTIQALVKYNDREDVQAALDRAVEKLSAMQRAEGTYASWGSVASESSAQVICALTALGINPDTDERFIKNGSSVVDGMLGFYLEDSHTFAHALQNGSLSTNAMATIQCGYSMVAYQRMINGKNRLYDMTDVSVTTYDENGFMEISAILTAPAIISNEADTEFYAQISLTGWDAEKDYKLMDAIIVIPDGLSVKDVTANEKLTGGSMYYELEEAAHKLRIVYSDLEGFGNMSFTAEAFPAELFTIKLSLNEKMDTDSVTLAITGMSLKLGSDSQDPAMMHIINTSSASAQAQIELKNERAVFAYIMYTGDGVDLIATDMEAVAVLVTETDESITASYKGAELLYSAQLTEKTGVTTYVAVMSTENTLTELNDTANYTFTEKAPDDITFGDVNSDGVINAQDALNTVNAWMRKGSAPTENTILAMNVNGDSRINTFDAVGIVDNFVNGSAFIIVTSAQMPNA